MSKNIIYKIIVEEKKKTNYDWKELYIIINIIFKLYYRSELSENNLAKDFIDFFNTYFKKDDFTEEMDLNIRYYVSILQSYMEYIKAQNKELIKEWENNIRPFLIQQYPFQQDGIFNMNADIKYLIQEIDVLIKKEKNKNKSNIHIRLNNDNIYVKKKVTWKDYDKDKNKEKEKEREEDLSPLKINNLNIEKEQEQVHQKYNTNFNINVIKNFEEKNNNTNKRKLQINNNTYIFSSSIASKSTSVSSIYDEINKIDTSSNYLSENNCKTRSFIINKEISPLYAEEFETERITILHRKNDNKIISKMSFNLFLKKIVLHNFYNEYITYVTNFSEQCFYFLKKDIIFKKVINCYSYYSSLKVPFNQRKNLICFINLLIIKMFMHYNKINNKDEVIMLIKDFYNNIISEIKQIINKSKTTGEKFQNFLIGGINVLRQSVSNINKNIKENIEKIKNNKTNNNISQAQSNIKLNTEKEDLKFKNNNVINESTNINNNNISDIKEKEGIEEEELIKECEKIISLLKTEEPKNEILAKMEKTLYIHKLKVKYKIKVYNSKKPDKKKLLSKSFSERTLPFFNILEKKPKYKKEKKDYFYCLEWDTRDIGEELIFVSQSTLNKINKKELYNGAFTKKTRQVHCPGIMETINRSNKLILFIIEDILSYDLPSIRAKVIEKWANVADYCRRRKDYNDIFAINSVFNNYIISNLFLTWKEAGSKTMKLVKDINKFCTIEGNYKNARDDMKELTRNDFYTPYLGMLLKDLNFYEESYKYLDGANLINFDKINGVQNAIDEFFHFQKTVDKKVTVLNEKLNFFEKLENLKEMDLEKLADKIEPKFTLYKTPQTEKRLTSIDKIYFQEDNNISKSKTVNNVVDNIINNDNDNNNNNISKSNTINNLLDYNNL